MLENYCNVDDTWTTPKTVLWPRAYIHVCVHEADTHVQTQRERTEREISENKNQTDQNKTQQITINKNTKQKVTTNKKPMAPLSDDLWRLVPRASLTCTLCVAGHRDRWGPQFMQNSCDGGRVSLSWPKIWHRHARPTERRVSLLSAHFHLKGVITPRWAGPGQNDPVAPRGADTGEVADSSWDWVKKTRGIIRMSHSPKMVGSACPALRGLAHSLPLQTQTPHLLLSPKD